MKPSRILILLSVFGIGWLSAALLPPTALLPNAGTETATEVARAHDTQARVAQQQFGSRCSTAQGSCPLPRPKPIGSACDCAGVPGTTIR